MVVEIIKKAGTENLQTMCGGWKLLTLPAKFLTTQEEVTLILIPCFRSKWHLRDCEMCGKIAWSVACFLKAV